MEEEQILAELGRQPVRIVFTDGLIPWEYTLQENHPVLDFREVVNICGENDRPFIQGSQLMACGIITIGTCEVSTENVIKIFALVMQASDCDGPPYQVFVAIKNVNNIRVIEAECPCTGGGDKKCKHIVAVALRLFRENLANLEPISCTDLIQRWGSTAMKKYSSNFAGTQLQKQCHFTAKIVSDLPTLSSGLSEALVKIPSSRLDECELSRFNRCNRRLLHERHDEEPHKKVMRALTVVKSVRVTNEPPPPLPNANAKLRCLTTPSHANLHPPRKVLSDIQNMLPQKINCEAIKEKMKTSPQTTGENKNERLQEQKLKRSKLKAESNDRYSRWVNTINKNRESIPCSPVLDFHNFMEMHTCDISDLIVHSEQVSGMESAELAYFNQNVSVTLNRAYDIFIKTADGSSHEFYSSERNKKRITGTSCYDIFRCTIPLSNCGYWMQKLAKVINPTFKGNWNTKRGLADEPFARRCFELKHDVQVFRCGTLISSKAPWLAVTLDGIVPKNYTVEIKSPEKGIDMTASSLLNSLEYVERNPDGSHSLKKKHQYYGQVQLGMALTGYKKCMFVLYASIDDTVAEIEVPFNEDYVSIMIKKVTAVYFQFYFQLVLPNQSL